VFFDSEEKNCAGCYHTKIIEEYGVEENLFTQTY
jgi:hypothetical protein